MLAANAAADSSSNSFPLQRRFGLQVAGSKGTAMASHTTPGPKEIRAELGQILASSPFAGAHRSQQFLLYVVENSLENRDAALKEYTIAIEVFGREPSYDPSIDATVRVEAGRLRSRLHEYYAEEGKQDPLIIDIPKGGYRATFVERASVSAATTPLPTLSAEVQASAAKTVPPAGRRILGWSLGVLCLMAAGLAGLLFLHPHGARPEAQESSPRVLAVLPFTNLTGSPAYNYITEGLSDNLIRQLAELPHLRVISRAAADHTPISALTGLGVTKLLRGELRRDPDGQAMLNIELSNAKDGAVLRSSQHIADTSDLQSVQADIVHDVIEGLGMELDARQSADAKRPLTSSPGAFQSYLRGESAAREQNAHGLHTAISDYEDAIRQDPGFALAYAALAGSHALLGLYFESAREHMPLVREYAERALALDPSLREPHGMLGLVHLVYDWDYSAAQRELAAADAREVAISALSCTAHLLGSSGNIRHAEEDVRRMLEFDPHSPALIGEMGCVKYYAGRYDESIHYYRQAIAVDPRSTVVNWGLGRALEGEGHHAEALAVLRSFKANNGFEPPIITAEIGYTEGASGERKAALETAQLLEHASAHAYVDPYLIALIYLSVRDEDSVYAWLEKAYAERSPFLISIATDPKWTARREDVRFKDLLGRMTNHAGEVALAGDEKQSSR
jgi:TolB-like protein